MASRSIGQIFAELALRDSNFNKGLTKAATAVTRFGSKAAVGAAAAGAAMTTAMAAGVKHTMSMTDDLVDLSDQTGIAVADLMTLQQAYRDGGREADATGSDIAKMQKAIVTAAEGGADPFKALGLSAKKLLDESPLSEFEQIGAAINKGEGPFKDQTTSELKRLYASITDDQEKVAQSLGMGDKWGVAKGLVKQRKDLEDHMVTALGKDLSGTFTSKLSPAIQGLRKGNVQAFDKLIEATPPSMRQEVVASALNDVFTLGSRKEQQLSIPGFVDWYAGAKKSGALDRVMKHLPPEARRNLTNIYKVSAGIRKANEEAISTGRLNTLIESIDGRNGVLEHLYGAAEKGAAVAGGSIGAAAAGAPGAAIGTALGAALGQAAGKKLQLPARSIAADALMSDPKFQQALIKATEKNKKTASKVVENLPAWKKFAGHLSGDEAKQVARVGALAWLNNDIEE